MKNQVYLTETKRKRRSESGNVLLFTLMISVLIFVIGVWSFRSVLSQSRMADQSYRMQQAIAASEAGIELAVNELNKKTFSGYDGNDWAGWDQSGAAYTTEQTIQAEGVTVCEFVVAVAEPLGTTPTVEATGYIPSIDNPRAVRAVRVVVVNNRERPKYIAAIETVQDVHVAGGGDTCSFNSANGAPPASPNQANTHGNVITHGSAFFDNGTDVFGSVEAVGTITGPAGLVQGTNVDGQVNNSIPNGDPPPVPPYPDADHEAAKLVNNNLTGITPPNGMNLNDIYDPVTKALTLDANNRTINLAPGVYFFSKIDLNGNSGQIVVEPVGQVKIYLEADNPGDIVFHLNNNGDMNATSIPPNMEINVKSGNIWWENAGKVYSPVFAPNSDVQADNAFDMFGALICRNANIMGGGTFTYDEALGDPSPSEKGARVTDWIELTPS